MLEAHKKTGRVSNGEQNPLGLAQRRPLYRNALIGPAFFLWGLLMFHLPNAEWSTEHTFNLQLIFWLAYQAAFVTTLAATYLLGKKVYLAFIDRRFIIAAVIITAGGTSGALLCGGISAPYGVLGAISSIIVGSIGYSLLTICWGAAFIRLQPHVAAASICAGLLLTAAMFFAIAQLPSIARYAVTVALPALSLVLIKIPESGTEYKAHDKEDSPKMASLIVRVWLGMGLIGLLMGYVRGSNFLAGQNGDPFTTALMFAIPAAIAIAVQIPVSRMGPKTLSQFGTAVLAVPSILLLAVLLPNVDTLSFITIYTRSLWLLTEIVFWSTLATPHTLSRAESLNLFSKKRLFMQGGMLIGGLAGCGLGFASAFATPYVPFAFGLVTYIAFIIAITSQGKAVALDMKSAESAMFGPAGDGKGSNATINVSPELTLEEACDEVANAHSLTPREREVLALLARGRNAEFVSKELYISVATAKTHIKHIHTKAGVHNRQELLDLIYKARNRDGTSS